MFRIYALLAAFVVLVLPIQYTFSACSPDSNGSPRVGTGCEYTCHCKTASEQCDEVTGHCDTGCATGWMGPGCQYRDLAFGKYSTQIDSHISNKYTFHANDGDLTTCSRTAVLDLTVDSRLTTEPWWRVNIGDKRVIQGLVITTKSGAEHTFVGFKVYIESTNQYDYTGYQHQHTCYKHDAKTPMSTTMYVTCNEPMLGNQVRIQLASKQSQLILCDVKIYEGRNLAYGRKPSQISQYGTGTDASLAVDGYMRTCSITDWERNPWWMVNLGQIYIIHTIRINYYNNAHQRDYKLEARNDSNTTWTTVHSYTTTASASVDLRGSITTRLLRLKVQRLAFTPIRLAVCDFKVVGECPKYQCGLDCTEPCYCKDFSMKDRLSGICQSGCDTRWSGEKCNTDCEHDEWGDSCTNVCGSCYDGTTCDVINGTCIYGCMPGYKTTAMCTEECEDGTYGMKCIYECGNCQGGVENCNKSTGSCFLGCTEGFDGATCQSQIPVPSTVLAVIGVVVAVILVVAGVIFAVFSIRRKRRHLGIQQRTVETIELDRTSHDRTTEHGQGNLSNRNDIRMYSEAGMANSISDDFQQQSTTRSDTNKPTSKANPTKPHIDTPIQRKVPKQAVWLTSLNEYIRSNILHKKHLTKEFNTLPYGLVHPATVALKPTNRPKNRYSDMYSYDHSRVVLRTLPGQPDSDYINASFINGHKKKNAYIAAQAPTIDNIDEFWRMIWEKEVSKIVMVTNLIEDGKVKCLQYWNCDESPIYGDISVTVTSAEVFAEFTIRTFIVKSISTKQRITVTQFHFTLWSDKSTPKRLTSLVQFWSKVRKDDVESSHPWLVHCSAGVGRTGTVIALDILYDQGKELNYVNVYQCVQELRRQCVNMVQTQEQYTYLHEVVFEALVVHVQAIPIQHFENEYRNLLQVERTTGISGLMSGFERILGDIVDLSNEDLTDIEEACSDRKEVFAAAKRAENRNKNRYNNILTSNNYRPFLSSHVPGYNDYINAVYVPSNRNLRGYILSQTPLENTAVDCCRLVSEHKIQVIVTFDDSGSEKVGNYLPDTGTLTVGPFEVELTSEERKDDYNIRNYKMQFKGEGQWCIMQLVFTKWSTEDTVPRDHNALLNLIQEVEAQQQLVKGTCILVQCLNGAERSGLFVVLMNVLERMRIEQEVAIPQVIRQMRQIRQQILPTYEQFKFCHEVVLRHASQNTSS